MARALSQIVTIIRGSVGGLTYFAGPHHQIQIRARTAPVQPSSIFRTSIKANFSSAVANWESASQDDRDGWDAYAQTVTLQGPLGSYQPSGRDLAVGQFAVVGYLDDFAEGVVVWDRSMDPPILPGQLSMSNIQVTDPAAPGIGFGVSIKNVGNGEVVNLFAQKSFPQSNSRNFYKGPFRASTMKAVAVDDGTFGVIEFSANIVDQVHFVRLRVVSGDAPYRMSPPFIVRAVSRETVV